MKIITRAVLDWDGNVLEEDSYEYRGPIAAAKDSGSPPQPVDPYTQANAQYELATGTAGYNAALNRTGAVNPLGESGWNITGYSGGAPTQSFPATSSQPTGSSPENIGGSAFPDGTSGTGFSLANGGYALGSGSPGSSMPGSIPGSAFGLGGPQSGSGAPLYTQQTSLDPWANNLLESPIDTSQMPGMPGGPSLEQNVNQSENAAFDQQMSLLQPQEQMQTEQNQAQLEAEGAMPGSAAYDYGVQSLGRTQGAQNAQVANNAVQTGMNQLPMLYGLGSTSLQNQLAERNAPISEYEQLLGNGSGGQVSAATPDISGAFGQQYSGALAGYNANTATNNANTQAGIGLAGMLALALM